MSQPLTPSYDIPLPKWLRLYLPLAILIYPLFLAVPGWNWEDRVYREFGLVENLTVLFLGLSFYFSVRALLAEAGWMRRVVLALFALGCFFFLGEEISWGQHFGNWTPPEDWKQLNRQNETNLHNMMGWTEFLFTTVIRNALCIGVLVGSILAPWWLRKRQAPAPGSMNFWLWPASQSALVAILVNASVLPRKISRKIIGQDLPVPYIGHDDGEMKELLIALFFMLYAIVQWRLSRQMRAQSAVVAG